MFEEFLNKIKELAKGYSRMDDLIDDNEGFEKIKFIETIRAEEHRWFTLEDNIFEINLDGKDYYFGATEVGTLKSEAMGVEDTGWETKIFEVEKITRETFRRIN